MTEPKSITLDYFAIFREYRNLDRELVVTSATSAEQLYLELKERHGFPLPLDALRVAINEEFTSWAQELHEGDRVAFIAPVAGG